MTRLRRLSACLALALPAALAVPSIAKAPTAPTFGTGQPVYLVSAAPDGLPSADFAGEPSLGVSWKSRRALFQANTSTYALTFDDHVTPPSVTWSDVSSPYSVFNMDPILATDPASGVTLAGGDDGSCAVMSRTEDDGESWSPAAPCTGFIDHPTVGIGPGTGGVPLVGYFCQQYPLVDQCSRSTDGGRTWSPSVPVDGCIGLFGHVKIGRDGTAYVPHRGCTTAGDRLTTGNPTVGGFRTTDNGLTWTPYAIPKGTYPSRGFDPSVAITTNGTLFEAWTGSGTTHPLVAHSATKGDTWSDITDLASTVSPPLTGSVFPTMVAGDPGRAAVAFLGTRVATPGTVALDDKAAIWDLYVSTTYDDGRTWTTTQVTTDPVQRGPIADGGTTAIDGRNLLDFMDAGVTDDGRVVVAFADGCLASHKCLDSGAGPATSTDAHATIAYQYGGRGLLALYDVQPPRRR